MDRDKALDLALANIEKQFGKGSLMKLGDAAAVKIPAIPTGALSLDLALGIGGVPRGRVVEIYGPESSGKCHPADTHVWTDHGLETIEELFARVDQPASCTSRVTDVRDHGIRLVNEEAGLETMAAVTHNNRRPVRRVLLDSGRHVEATANHPLRVLNERGRIVWRAVGKLREGDVLVSALFGAETAVGGSELSEDEAVLLGYLVGEGTMGASNRNAVTFTNAHDPDVFEEYARLVADVLGVTRERIKTHGDINHHIHDTALRQRLHDDYGLAFVGSAGKDVPHVVRTGGAKIQRAFLSALYEGDGWIEAGPAVGLTTASRKLAEQVQLLLYGLGIPATLRTRHNEQLERDHHTLLIGPGAVQRFLEQIGFRSARRAAQVEHHLAAAPGATPASRHEHVPHVGPLLRDLRDAMRGDRELDRLISDLRRGDLTSRADGVIDCSSTRLLAVLDWIEQRHVPANARPLVAQLFEMAARPFTYERVVALEDVGPVPTFDVVVPRTHSFVANGVLSHNTTVALHAVAEAQKAGGIAAFIDAEHALDPQYARALGVDINELLVSQPDTGEQALEIADMLVRSSAVDIIVIDSVAALTPRAEIEGEMGDSHVGLQARLMSQALRKLAGSLSKSKTCAVFINQLREKVGVMFGCMSSDTRVTLADGTQEKIGKIVTQQLPVEVLSYDTERDEFVPRKIVNWFDNGPTDEFLRFTVARGSGNGRSQFSATENHLISTPHGWVHAGELEVGDSVLQAVDHHLSPFQWDVVLGSLMGVAALSPSRSGHGVRLQFGHEPKQSVYADWKASLFANLRASRTTDDKGAVFYDFQSLPELAELRRAVYLGGKKILSWDYLKRLTPLSIAVWYQDDGNFTLRSRGLQQRSRGGSGRSELCVETLERTSRERLRSHLADTWDLHAKLIDRAGKAVLQFPTAETAKLHALVAPFVHPSMQYKLLPRFRGQFGVEPVFGPVRKVATPMPIVRIERQPPDGRHTHRFDIEVEGTHSYLVDGIVVHNSPETTPGGRALKFYSSVRLDVRRIETLKDGTNAVGNRVRVKVVKNKCVAAGTLVYDAVSGLTHPIEELAEVGDSAMVWAADKAGTFHLRPVLRWMDQGEQDTIGLALRDGSELVVTPDHRILTEHGWREAGELRAGDRVARPRRVGSFGDTEPIPPHHARMLGYLIGDGSVGDKTPAFINADEELRADASRLADELGPDKRIPAALLAPDVSAEVLGNLIFGLWESNGWISREQTGGLRVGFVTTSEQLARQVHWALLRWGVASAVQVQQPGSRRSLIAGRRVEAKPSCWQVRISGIDNVTRFAEALPMWGPKGHKLTSLLEDPELKKHRGSRTIYLPETQTAPVVAYLQGLGLRPTHVATLVGDIAGNPNGGYRSVLGSPRLRRDRMERLAHALDSSFLRDVLAEELYYDRIVAIEDRGRRPTYDIEVDEHHTFVANGIVVHNCAPPFRQAEFDILFGEGISKEGSLIDVGVEELIIRKAGAWYTYDGEQLGQGKENARQFLKEHADVAREIEKKVKEKLGLEPLAAEDLDAPDLDEKA